MDPVTAFCNMITAGINLFVKVIDGQPPDVRARLWELYLQDVEKSRAIWDNLISQFKLPAATK